MRRACSVFIQPIKGVVVNRLRLFGVAVLAVFAVGVAVASSASALLPTILFLSGTTSVLLKGSLTGVGAGHFGSIGEQINAKKVTVELTALTNDTHLGAILLIFAESINENNEECTGEGQPAGTVHVTGEWHLVYTGLGASLNVGLLVLVPATKFKCNLTNITVEGSVLSTFKEGAKEGEDITEAGSIAECEGANLNKPKHPKYENEAGTTVEASLKATIAGIKEAVCESTSSELKVKGQMFKVDL
jgi:hypothetical protein